MKQTYILHYTLKLDHLQRTAVILFVNIFYNSSSPQINMTFCVNFPLAPTAELFHFPLLYCISFRAEHPPGGQVALQAREDPGAIQRRKPQLVPSVHVR